MLEIGNKTITVDGITVFADHADPNQFWYLPGPVGVARRPADNRADFTFIKYGDVQGGNVTGGGFLTFSTNLHLNPRLERRILSRLSSLSPDRPRLAAVPFDEGTVHCIGLNLQGSGGTTAEISNDGTFNAVESILGASVPSLHGDNTASFGLTLSQQGATILEQVFEDEGTPVGVIYNLIYSGLRPALEVEITAELERVYNHFSAGLEAQVYWLRAGIDAGFEKLVQEGLIQIKVINFSTAADRQEKEEWALEFFKEKLLADWFRPTLTPGQLAGGMAEAENLESVQNLAERLRPPRTEPPSNTSTGTNDQPDSGGQPTNNEDNDSSIPTAQSGADDNSGAPEPGGVIPNIPVITNPAGQVSNSQGEMPPRTDAATPVSASGLGFQSPSTPSRSNLQIDTAIVSFKLKIIRQEELKKITFRYTRSEAVQRTYSPQGFFGLMAQDLSREGHFFDVDLDDAFFREFIVSIESPFDQSSIGLASAHVQLDYGDPNETETQKHKDFVIDSTTNEKVEWLVKNIPGLSRYDYQVQYHFDPDSDWVGEKFSYNLPTVTTEDRTLLIHPFEMLGFLEVELTTGLIDWSIVSNVEVLLQYESPNGWQSEKTFFFSESSQEPQNWKLRLSNPDARDFSQRFIYSLKDGKKRTLESNTVRTTKVAVPNPFFAINIEFIPLFTLNQFRFIFIDVEYIDDINNYTQHERLRVEGTSVDSAILRLHIINPEQKDYRYRLTTIGNDGSMNRGLFIETSETLIGIGA